MTKPLRPTPSRRLKTVAGRRALPQPAGFAVVLLGFCVSSGLLAAIDVSQWKHRQPVTVDSPGLARLVLPPAALDASTAQLTDLRLVDPKGMEVGFALQPAVAPTPARAVRPKGFRTSIVGEQTEIRIETGTAERLTGVGLVTPSPALFKAARVEISKDGEQWTMHRAGAVLFRQHGAEQLTLDLDGQPAAHLRILIDDTRTRPVPFTAATVFVDPEHKPAPTVPLEGAALSRREEFAGETVLTLDLGARHVPMARITFDTPELLFTRNVRVAVRTLSGEVATEQILGTGSIYRVSGEALAAAEKRELALDFTAPARELVVHIENGDSPPLEITRVRVDQRPVAILFTASTAGTYHLLTGNPGAPRPHYDLAALSSALVHARPVGSTVGPLERNADYRERDPSSPLPALLGGPIDARPWRFSKPVRFEGTAVQQLELDVDVLAGSNGQLSDLRLVRENAQVPYLLERPAVSRSLLLEPELVADPKSPQLSRWRISLPRARVPADRLTLSSSSPLFERHLRVYERIRSEQGEHVRELGEAAWHRVPGASGRLVLPLVDRPATDTLWIETDNGDNPGITLTSAALTYPVARVIFKTTPGPLTLHYGNPQAGAPRYDIGLVAPQLMNAPRQVATLGEETGAKPSPWASITQLESGVAFWGALGVVVIGLLIVVAKLLPKPGR